jgi:lysophospholipase L1-like esterase
MKYSKILTIYLVLLHLVLVVILVKSNFLGLVALKFNQLPEELSPNYYSLLSFQKRVDAQLSENSVIFIGDSLIQGLAVSEIVPHSVNFGIGADTTLGVLTRLESYQSLAKAKNIFLTIGLNDLKRRNNTEIINNYRKILTVLPKDRPVTIGAILPVDERVSSVGSRNKRIKALNLMLEKLTHQFKNIQFISINLLLLDETGNLKERFHIGDGLHLNKAGYGVWVNQLKKYLNSSQS